MSLYDDPSDRLMKYDGACWKCHGNPRLCDGESGDCGALKKLLADLPQEHDFREYTDLDEQVAKLKDIAFEHRPELAYPDVLFYQGTTNRLPKWTRSYEGAMELWGELPDDQRHLIERQFDAGREGNMAVSRVPYAVIALAWIAWKTKAVKP